MIISIEALLLATYLVGSRTVMQMQISNAIGYAKFFSHSYDAVIRVSDEGEAVIETHEHAGDFREAS